MGDPTPSSGPVLTERLARHLPHPAPANPAFERALSDWMAAAQAAWPALPNHLDAFLAFLGQRLAPLPPAAWPETLTGLRAEELARAFACATGDPHALAWLEREHLARLEGVLRTFDPGETFADDVRQLLRERLLLPRPGRPAIILDYSGRGPFRMWLRSAALRTAINLRERAGRPWAVLEEEEALGRVTTESGDPDLSMLRERFQPAFAEAFQAALRALSSEQRNLMRLYLLDDLSIDKLAVLFQAHRSTMARRILRDRAMLVEYTQRELAVALQLPRAELEELMALVQSQLDVSLKRFLERTHG